MITYFEKRHNSLSYRILSAFIAFAFVISVVLPPSAAAQLALNLPVPGAMIMPGPVFTPTLIKGLTIHPENPLEFDFIVEKGQTPLQGEEFNKESMRLVKYFLASLTVPEDQMWVNLSPHEKDRIISENLGATEMGKDMLAQDYILKQLTASLMYPENELGKKFWDRIYKKAREQYGTTDIPVDTFNKVWIMPDRAVVYEHEGSVFVIESHLRVMLDSDYAAQKLDPRSSMLDTREPSSIQHPASSIETSIIKEIILPEIEKEVNAGETFANLRQIYHSMILATWYKKNLRESLLGQVYVDKSKTRGVDLKDQTVNQKIYEQYLEAFKKGVYNYIKEDIDPLTQEIIPRKYFSGGAVGLKESNLTTLYSLPQRQQAEIITAFRETGNSPDARFRSLKIKLYEIAETNNIPEDTMTEIVRGIEDTTADEAKELFVGQTVSSPVVARVEEIKGLLQEIEKERQTPGSGNLPQIAVLSDFHGGLNRFIMLLSDVLNNLAGFQGQLDPNRTIEEQLTAQRLSFQDIKGQIVLGGDILDRGKHGIKIFLLIKELVEKGEGKVVSVTGNHDLWAFANLLGLHIPWYKGFQFYGDTEAENLIARYRQANPELFDTPESVLWWTERLAEHNADQDAYQKKAFDGNVKEVRNRFIEDYKVFQKNWTDPQKDAMEKFIGYFARIGVTDPYVGLNGLGKTSALWWKQVLNQLNKGYEARRSLGAEDAELSVWQEAIALAEKTSREANWRLDQALNDGKWWYRIFESINTHAYRSVEWSAKDWSSHKGWGDSVIAEINEMIDAGLIYEEKLTQKNYIQSQTLQALAYFYRDNFNLHALTPYGDLFSHGGFPVNSDGTINILYKSVTYKGKDIFSGLSAVSNDVKDPEKSLQEIWEALHLVNTWYADMTTELKPAYIKRNIDQIGILKINKGIGVRHHVTGHNPIALGKLAGRPFMAGDSGYTHAFADFGMSEKYGGQGGWVSMSAGGVKLRGFESETSDTLVDNPRTHVWDKETGQIKKTIENPGLKKDIFLSGAKEQLSEELTRLQSVASPLSKEEGARRVGDLFDSLWEMGGFRVPEVVVGWMEAAGIDFARYAEGGKIYDNDSFNAGENIPLWLGGNRAVVMTKDNLQNMMRDLIERDPDTAGNLIEELEAAVAHFQTRALIRDRIDILVEQQEELMQKIESTRGVIAGIEEKIREKEIRISKLSQEERAELQNENAAWKKALKEMSGLVADLRSTEKDLAKLRKGSEYSSSPAGEPSKSKTQQRIVRWKDAQKRRFDIIHVTLPRIAEEIKAALRWEQDNIHPNFRSKINYERAYRDPIKALDSGVLNELDALGITKSRKKLASTRLELRNLEHEMNFIFSQVPENFQRQLWNNKGDFFIFPDGTREKFTASSPATDLEKLARRLDVAPKDVDGVIEEYARAVGEIVERIPVVLPSSKQRKAVDLFMDPSSRPADVIIGLIYKQEYISQERIDELRGDAWKMVEGPGLGISVDGVEPMADFFRGEKGLENLYGKTVAEDLRGDFRLLRELLETGLPGLTLTRAQIFDKTAIRNVIKDTILAASSPVVDLDKKTLEELQYAEKRFTELAEEVNKDIAELKGEIEEVKDTKYSEWRKNKVSPELIRTEEHLLAINDELKRVREAIRKRKGEEIRPVSSPVSFRGISPKAGEKLFDMMPLTDGERSNIEVVAIETGRGVLHERQAFVVLFGGRQLKVYLTPEAVKALEDAVKAGNSIKNIIGEEFDRLDNETTDIDVVLDEVRMVGEGLGVSSSPTTGDMFTKGGIDLNPALLDLQIKRDGNGVPLPLPMQPVGNMHIDGFLPIIINVTPVMNLPLLLGIADDDSPADSANSGAPLMELGFAVKEN